MLNFYQIASTNGICCLKNFDQLINPAYYASSFLSKYRQKSSIHAETLNLSSVNALHLVKAKLLAIGKELKQGEGGKEFR